MHGRHDERFRGHAPLCAAAVYAGIVTETGLADQAAVIATWVRLAASLDVPGVDDLWRRLTASLVDRADALHLEYPVPGDLRELEPVR